jgi:hypothetical protein
MHRPKIDGEVALGHLRLGDPTVNQVSFRRAQLQLVWVYALGVGLSLGKFPAIRGKTARQGPSRDDGLGDFVCPLGPTGHAGLSG